MTEAGYRKEYPKPEAEKAALRRVMRAINADVVALQEMGDQAYLDELRHDLKNEGLDYPYAALAEAEDANRHIALLAKRPLKRVSTHTDLEFAYLGGRERVKRGLLEATIATPAGEVTIFALHLKSRFTERPDDPLCAAKRAAEATAIRERVLKEFPNSGQARFVVLGDCNDNKASKAVGHLQKRGKTDAMILLPATDARGETWTHCYRREETYSHVDQILVSPALREFVRGHTARIYDGDGVTVASDHRPVVAVFELPK
jgi:endonuclease/exonuclease/phosphatase family metal-dependent hydrolase